MLLLDHTPVLRPDKATSQTRKSKKIKGLRLVARIFLFFILYLCWPLCRRWLRPGVVFAVYGTKKDQRAYWPDWIHRRLRCVFPIGMIRFANHWGLVCATKVSAEEFNENPKLALEYLEGIQKEFPRAKTVALAGGLSGWVSRSNGSFKRPFVSGSLGTRYAMVQAVREAAKKSGKESSEATLALLGGGGFTGRKVAKDLVNDFQEILALDPRFNKTTQSGKLVSSPELERVDEAKFALVLTQKGDDIRDMTKYFSPGTVVVDDTHPCISSPVRAFLQAQGVDLWKAVMSDGRLQMIPRMPNFRRDNIPGCLLEALVVLLRGREVLASPDKFFQAASELGFHAELMRHPED